MNGQAGFGASAVIPLHLDSTTPSWDAVRMPVVFGNCSLRVPLLFVASGELRNCSRAFNLQNNPCSVKSNGVYGFPPTLRGENLCTISQQKNEKPITEDYLINHTLGQYKVLTA